MSDCHATHVVVNENVIDVDALTRLVSHPSCGAISSFIGITRDSFENKTVTRLDYEAYGPMAEKEMSKVADEVSCSGRS